MFHPDHSFEQFLLLLQNNPIERDTYVHAFDTMVIQKPRLIFNRLIESLRQLAPDNPSACKDNCAGWIEGHSITRSVISPRQRRPPVVDKCYYDSSTTTTEILTDDEDVGCHLFEEFVAAVSIILHPNPHVSLEHHLFPQASFYTKDVVDGECDTRPKDFMSFCFQSAMWHLDEMIKAFKVRLMPFKASCSPFCMKQLWFKTVFSKMDNQVEEWISQNGPFSMCATHPQHIHTCCLASGLLYKFITDPDFPVWFSNQESVHMSDVIVRAFRFNCYDDATRYCDMLRIILRSWPLPYWFVKDNFESDFDVVYMKFSSQ